MLHENVCCTYQNKFFYYYSNPYFAYWQSAYGILIIDKWIPYYNNIHSIPIGEVFTHK
jgi:hypothetical protein